MQVPQLQWKKTTDMDLGVSEAQGVAVGGKLYIGGGSAEGDNYKVLEYTIQGGQWGEISAELRQIGRAHV